MDDSFSVTDDEDVDDEDFEIRPSEFHVILQKWTNYINGWQKRYFIAKDGSLSYYKSESEVNFGSRGTISLAKAEIKEHEFDHLRFDIVISDSIWYCRVSSKERRRYVVDMLQANKRDSGFGSTTSLRRYGSLFSLQSIGTTSAASTHSFRRCRNLREKLAEMETFKDILCKQVDTLQAYFDSCAEACGGPDPLQVDFDEDADDATDTNASISFGEFNKAPASGDCLGGGLLGLDRKQVLDFKGQAITFKATTTGILATLQHCLDVLRAREETWQSKYDKEVERRSRLEKLCLKLKTKLDQSARINGPDFQEGPHSSLTDEMWYDAVERAMDESSVSSEEDNNNERGRSDSFGKSSRSNKNTTTISQEQQQIRDEGDGENFDDHTPSATQNCPGRYQSSLGRRNGHSQHPSPNSDHGLVEKESPYLDPKQCPRLPPQKSAFSGLPTVQVPKSIALQSDATHYLAEQCDTYVRENLSYAFAGFNQSESCQNQEPDGGWELLHAEGDMKVFRKEVELDGVVIDPLKATHSIRGLTAHEICSYFFEPSTKMEWEGHLLEWAKVLERVAPDTVVVHALMKRVWPSAPRDLLYASHMRHVCSSENGQNDTWIVCNFSIDSDKGAHIDNCIRAVIRASMVCQTIISQPKGPSSPLSRQDISCKIWYMADVNPGGWAPASVLRQIYKREYPKFLRKFTSYVASKCENLPIQL